MKTNSKFYGFKIFGKHTSELGLECVGREVGFPEKNKVLVDIPYSNTPIDYSELYGIQTFSQRTLMYRFKIERDHSYEVVYRKWTEVVNWLTAKSGQHPLYDDYMNRFYYLAELVQSPSYEEFVNHGELQLTFTAYPFRIDSSPEGNDIWDEFDFEFDVAINTKFDVRGTKEVFLINNGTNTIRPRIITNANITIEHNNRVYEFPSGSHERHRLYLDVGEQTLKVNGIGSVEFIYYKEVI